MGFGDFCSPSLRTSPSVIVLRGSVICRGLTGWEQRDMVSPYIIPVLPRALPSLTSHSPTLPPARHLPPPSPSHHCRFLPADSLLPAQAHPGLHTLYLHFREPEAPSPRAQTNRYGTGRRDEFPSQSFTLHYDPRGRVYRFHFPDEQPEREGRTSQGPLSRLVIKYFPARI